MNVLNKILKWTKDLPKWQSDAVRRLLQQKGSLSKNDYDELYILLKAEHELLKSGRLKPEPLDDSNISVIIQPGLNIILEEVGKLTHVNRIASDQELKFSEKGMSIIYGDNGSGKSGYARVIKQACRYRGKEDKVYPNAYDPASEDKIPTAIFKIKKDSNSSDTIPIHWKAGCEANENLSNISVFDSRCALSYIADEQDVAYIPYGLGSIENLANDVIPELERRLTAEIDTINIKNIFYKEGETETEVSTLLSKLSFETNIETIKSLGILSNEEEKRIAELDKVLTDPDPIVKMENIKRFASRLKTAAENVKRVESLINDEVVNNLKNADDEMVEAAHAEKNAACALQLGKELLSGTGEPLWKALFEAARKYSTEVAYPDQEFPYTGDDAVCPLCQTPLDEAGERLKRFEQYIKNDVAKIANEKRENLTILREKIMNVNLSITLERELSGEIDQIDIVHAIKEYQTKIHEKHKWMLGALDNHGWDNPPDLAGSPYLSLCKLADQSLCEISTYIRVADTEHKKELEKERGELIARQELQKSQQGVLDLIDHMKEVEALKKCRGDFNTRLISGKSKELTSGVTEKLKSALGDEFYKLGIDHDHIKTKLKERAVKGKIFHRILLEIPTNKKIDDILSEGEHRAIAISAFLAELSLTNHSCGIVFDDPVSSLDHYRRQKVVSRLVIESTKRQVIVFTHDTSFLYMLRDEIKSHNDDTENHKIDSKICYLGWKDGKSGNIFDGLPWEHSGYSERIEYLEKKYRCLKNNPPQYPGEDDKAKMRDVYDRMRTTIERVIQDVVFNGVIERYNDWIRIGKLNDVVGFNDVECNKIKKIYKRCSRFGSSHDQSSAKNLPVPDARDLGEDIKNLQEVIAMIKERRKLANIKPTVSNSHNKQASK